jgi:4-oxalocrotonate tautomerase
MKKVENMPFIQFDGPELSKEKKAELVAELIQTYSEVLELPEQAFQILIGENSMDNIDAEGKLLSARHK